MTINLMPKKQVKQVTYKTLHIFTMITLILNMSMFGLFIAPNEARACHPTLTKGVSVDTAQKGEQITYDLTYHNPYDATYYNALLKDALPVNTSFVSATDGGYYDITENEIIWDLGDIPPYSPDQTVYFTVEILDSAECEAVIENQAVISYTYQNEAQSRSSELVYTTITCPTGSITVNKAVDADGDGQFEGGNQEANDLDFVWGLDEATPGRAMGSTANGIAIQSHKIDENIADGFHFVGWYVNESDYTCETTAYNTLPANILVENNSNVEITLCNARDTGDLGGIKFNDLNGNGAYDTGEPTIEGVEIQLDNGQSMITDENGAYLFESLPTGLYEVTEVVPINWLNTTQNPVANVEVLANQTAVVNFGNQEQTPSLTLIKSISESDLMPNGYINYTLNYENKGNVTLTNVVIIDDYPEIYVTVTDPGAAADDGDMLAWEIGTLTPGQTGSVSYAVSINETTPEDTEIINIATITSDQTNPLTATATALIPLPEEKGDPILSIVKTVDKEFVNPGDTAAYSVTITNTGDETAYNVELTDLLPARFTFAEYFTNQYTWTLGDLAAGNSITIAYDAVIGEDATEGVYDNLAVASADNHGNVTDKAPLEVRLPAVLAEQAKPLLEIEKTVNKEFINQGDEVTYIIRVTNIGDSSADAVAINVQVQDVMPAGFTFEDGEVTKTWLLGDIAVGETKEISYKAIADKTLIPGQYDNLAIAWADNHDKVSDSASVEVRKIQVLGETLPTTGGGFLTLLYIFIASLVILFAGFALKLTSSKEKS